MDCFNSFAMTGVKGNVFIDSGSSPEWQTKLQFIIYAEKSFKALRFCVTLFVTFKGFTDFKL